MARSLLLKPGMKCLDVGCGIGGPMRTIAAASGAHVTGITINDYQARGSEGGEGGIFAAFFFVAGEVGREGVGAAGPLPSPRISL